MPKVYLIEGTHRCAKLGVAIRRLLTFMAGLGGEFLIRLPGLRNYEAYSHSVAVVDTSGKDVVVSKLLRDLVGARDRTLYPRAGCTLTGDTFRSQQAERWRGAVLAAPDKRELVEEMVEDLTDDGQLWIATWLDNMRGTDGRSGRLEWLDKLRVTERIVIHHPDPQMHKQLLEIPGHKQAEAYKSVA